MARLSGTKRWRRYKHHPIMTANQAAAAVFCLLIALSAWETMRHLSPETGEDRKLMKLWRIAKLTKANALLVILGWGILFLLPGLWPLAVAITLYGLILNFRLRRKARSLEKEISAIVEGDSVISLSLGTMNDTEDGTPLKILFKRGTNSWPPVELEIAISHISLSIEVTRDEILRKYILPRIADALMHEDMEAICSSMKRDLLEHGVTHPIDIKGWNQHHIIREMIERIMMAELPS